MAALNAIIYFQSFLISVGFLIFGMAKILYNSKLLVCNFGISAKRLKLIYKNTPWHVKPLIHLLLTLRNIIIVNRGFQFLKMIQ